METKRAVVALVVEVEVAAGAGDAPPALPTRTRGMGDWLWAAPSDSSLPQATSELSSSVPVPSGTALSFSRRYATSPENQA